MTNKGNVGKTGEQLLDSISERLKNFPNISYMAYKVQDLLNLAKPMTGASSASAGVGGFVPAPPAQATTDNTYALLGSDGVWHTQAEATSGGNIVQKTLNKNGTQYITSERKSYLLGSITNTDTTQINNVYNVENMYATSFRGPSNASGSGILQKLNDDDLYYYYSSFITYVSGQSGTRLDYVGNIINRLQIDDSVTNNTSIESTNEFLLGKYAALISNSATKESEGGVPRAALVLGNTLFSAASTYKPYVLKVCGNDLSLYYSGQKDSNTNSPTHFIKSTLDTITPNSSDYKWHFVSNSGFLFHNTVEVTGSISMIPNLNSADYFLNNYGLYSSFFNTTELRFADTKYATVNNGEKAFREETGFDACYDFSLLYKTSWANTGSPNTGIAIAKYEYPTDGIADHNGTYSRINLAAFLKITDEVYISTDTKINGALNIWPQYISDDITSYKNMPNYAFSTRKNYKGQDIGNAEINFMGPYNENGSTDSTDAKIKDGIIKYTLSVNNKYVSGSTNYQKFDLISNNGFSSKTIASLIRSISSDYSADLTLDANIHLNNTRSVKEANDVTSKTVNATTSVTTSLVKADTIKASANTNISVDTKTNFSTGAIYASGSRVDLPVSESATSGAQNSTTFYYRPIIVTKSGSTTSATIKNILNNAKNGYIWIYTD